MDCANLGELSGLVLRCMVSCLGLKKQIYIKKAVAGENRQVELTL